MNPARPRLCFDMSRLGILAVAISGLFAFSAHAAIYNPAASAADGTPTSLRASIASANLNGENDVINLEAGTYTLDIANSAGQENVTFEGDLDLTESGFSITLQGAGATSTFIDQTVIDRVFHVFSGVTVELIDLTISSGEAVDNGATASMPGLGDGNGGGILNDGGNLTLRGSTVSQSLARGDDSDEGGGGIYQISGSLIITNMSGARSKIIGNAATGTWGSGGGLFIADGSLTTSSMNIDENTANRAGGGVEIVNGTADFNSNSFIRNNDVNGSAGIPNPGNGGGLHNSGAPAITFNNAIVSGNIAFNEGGGLWNAQFATMNVVQTQINGNTARGKGGGGIFNNAGVLNMLATGGPTSVNGNQATGANGEGSGGGILSTGGTVSLVGNGNQVSNISSNSAAGSGGGMYVASGSLQITNAYVQDNQSGNGAGIFALFATVDLVDAEIRNNNGVSGAGLYIVGNLTADSDTVISGNVAITPGGGIYTEGVNTTVNFMGSISGNQAPLGAGVHIGGGVLVVDGGTISNNAASINGGGINIAGGAPRVAYLINGSTLTGNTANGNGAGVSLDEDGGKLNIFNSSIEFNIANGLGGGVFNPGDGVVVIESSAIHGNEALDGGGIYNGGDPGGVGSLTIRDNSFLVSNIATRNGGGLYQASGAPGTVDIQNTSIVINEANGSGAARGGAGIFVEDFPFTLGGGVQVSANQLGSGTANGGGIHASGGSLTLNGTLVSANAKQGIYARNGAIVGLTDVNTNNISHGLETNGAGAVSIDGGVFSGIKTRSTSSVTTDGLVESSGDIDLETTGNITVQTVGWTGLADVVLSPGGVAQFAASSYSDYAGTTMLNSGLTQIDGTLNPSGGLITVASAAVLGGTGTIQRPVNVSGIIDPGPAGSSPLDTGTLTIESTVNFLPASSLRVSINATGPGTGYDVLKLNSTLSLDPTATLIGSATATFFDGTRFELIEMDSMLSIVGNFANAAPPSPPATIVLGAEEFNFSYNGDDGNDFELRTPRPADFGISKTNGVANVMPGGTTTYTIIASNAGPNDAYGAIVTDTFPPLLTCTWACAGSAGGACTVAGSGNISELVDLSANASVTFTASCMVSASATGTLSNTATISAPSGLTDPDAGNNSATDIDAVDNVSNVVISMTDSRDVVMAGEVLDYLIEVTNPAGPAAAIVNVDDMLPAALSGGTWDCAATGGAICGNASGSGNTLTDQLNIPVGGVVSYLFSATLPPTDTSDFITNTATASVINGTDPVTANNTVTDTNVVAIFLDGFDPGDTVTTQTLDQDSNFITAAWRFDTNLLSQVGARPVRIAKGVDANYDTLFAVQVARFGNDIKLRLQLGDLHGQMQSTRWKNLDPTQPLLSIAWQSASADTENGYISVQGGFAPLLILERDDQRRLASIQIRVEQQLPWLVPLTD